MQTCENCVNYEDGFCEVVLNYREPDDEACRAYKENEE